MTLGERIKKVRKEADFTQQEFGKHIGIKPNSVSLIESGSRNASDQVILSICREFNVKEEWLRTGKGEMFVKRAEADELAAAVNRLVTGESAEFKQRLVNALSTLKDEHWLLLEQKLKEIVGTRGTAFQVVDAKNETTAPERPGADTSGQARTEPDRRDYEAEARAEAEEYYRQILMEKKQAAGYSASPPDIGKMA